jgi:hypothetical protein
LWHVRAELWRLALDRFQRSRLRGATHSEAGIRWQFWDFIARTTVSQSSPTSPLIVHELPFQIPTSTWGITRWRQASHNTIWEWLHSLCLII